MANHNVRLSIALPLLPPPPRARLKGTVVKALKDSDVVLTSFTTRKPEGSASSAAKRMDDPPKVVEEKWLIDAIFNSVAKVQVGQHRPFKAARAHWSSDDDALPAKTPSPGHTAGRASTDSAAATVAAALAEAGPPIPAEEAMDVDESEMEDLVDGGVAHPDEEDGEEAEEDDDGDEDDGDEDSAAF